MKAPPAPPVLAPCQPCTWSSTYGVEDGVFTLTVHELVPGSFEWTVKSPPFAMFQSGGHGFRNSLEETKATAEKFAESLYPSSR